MKYLFFILCALVLGCTSQKSNDEAAIDLSNTTAEEISIIAKKMQMPGFEFEYSNYSFIQANNSGLYVTPATAIDGFALYRYTIKPEKEFTQVDSVVRLGRGPNELELLQMSSKTTSGDTLLFSSPFNKILLVNQSGELSEWDIDLYSKKVINYGYFFSYGNNNLLIPSFNPIQTDYLFTIYEVEGNQVYDSFPPRVPYGFEPSIRNVPVGETPLPDGFAISFLGDRKVYLLNEMGEINKEIILGESTIIPSPYKVKNPQDAPSAIPHIPKMEFYKGHLLVLADNIIWVVEYPSFNLKSKIRLLHNDQVETSPVIDFSVTDRYLYARIGREGMFYTETDRNWFLNR